MAKRITIWTNKGGNAKTSIAIGISKEFNFPVITNDTASPAADVLGEDWAIVLGLDEDIPQEIIESDQKLVFDLGGKAEDRVVIAAQQSDVVIMPVINNSMLDMSVFKKSVTAMLEINPNIVLVVAACKAGEFKATEAELNHFYPGLPVVEIKQSTAFAKMCATGKSISEICKEQPFLAHNYGKVLKQLHHLMEVSFEVCNAQKKAA